MPLTNGYGVVVGTVNLYAIEPPDSKGNWPHYQIYVDTPQGVYQCVINLKSRTDIKIEEKDLRDACRECFSDILALPDGFHRLAPEPDSGALDAIRHRGLQGEQVYPSADSWLGRFIPSMQNDKCITNNHSNWWRENSTDIIQLMEYYLTRPHRIYVFGEPYGDGRLGMHNVHMNQGDPRSSSFAEENGIWQDGGIILEYHDPQPRLSVIMTKFESQSLHTDDFGHPA
jgi:uncharacterized protein YukJ